MVYRSPERYRLGESRIQLWLRVAGCLSADGTVQPHRRPHSVQPCMSTAFEVSGSY